MSNLVMTKKCKNGDLACGSGYWYCGKCEVEMHKAAYARLTPEQKAYDDMVDPKFAYHWNYRDSDGGCSCHICPPCNYCVNKDEEEQEPKS